MGNYHEVGGEERAVAAALEINCGEEEIVFCFLCV